MNHPAEPPTATPITPEQAVEALDVAAAALAQADADLAQAQESLGQAQEGESARRLADARAGLELAQRRQGQAEAARVAAETEAARLVAALARDLGKRGLNRERRARVEFLDAVAELTPASATELARALGSIRSHGELSASRIEPMVRRWRLPEEVADAGPGRVLRQLRTIEASLP